MTTKLPLTAKIFYAAGFAAFVGLFAIGMGLTFQAYPVILGGTALSSLGFVGVACTLISAERLR